MGKPQRYPMTLTGMAVSATMVWVLTACGSARLPGQILEEVAVLGCVSCEGPTLFGFLRDVVVLDERTILVLDREAPMVRILDFRGGDVIAFGAQGGGPGEFRAPTHVSTRGNGDIQVVDVGSRSLTRFNARGTLVRSLRIPDIPVGAGHDALADVFYVVTSNVMTSRLERLNLDETFSVVIPSLEDVLPATPGHPLAVGPAVAPDGSFALGDGIDEYRIIVYGPNGNYLREIRRQVKPTRKPKVEFEAELQAARGRMGIVGDAAGRGDAPSGARRPAPVSEFRTFFDRSNGLEYDDHGTLWVRTNRGGTDETIFDFFDPSGDYAGEIALPKTVGAFDIAHGLLVGITSGAFDVPTVTVWSVEMNSPDS